MSIKPIVEIDKEHNKTRFIFILEDKKEYLENFEYELAEAEAKALSKLSLKRPLDKKEFLRYKEVMGMVMK